MEKQRGALFFRIGGCGNVARVWSFMGAVGSKCEVDRNFCCGIAMKLIGVKL